MNITQYAAAIEEFVSKELAVNPPITSLSNNIVVVNDLIVKKNKKEMWTLRRLSGPIIDSFYLKSSAIIAASFYSKNNFKSYSSLKILDDMYVKNKSDATRFYQRYVKSKDPDIRDIYISRYTESLGNAETAKAQLIKQFNHLF